MKVCLSILKILLVFFITDSVESTQAEMDAVDSILDAVAGEASPTPTPTTQSPEPGKVGRLAAKLTANQPPVEVKKAATTSAAPAKQEEPVKSGDTSAATPKVDDKKQPVNNAAKPKTEDKKKPDNNDKLVVDKAEEASKPAEMQAQEPAIKCEVVDDEKVEEKHNNAPDKNDIGSTVTENDKPSPSEAEPQEAISSPATEQIPDKNDNNADIEKHSQPSSAPENDKPVTDNSPELQLVPQAEKGDDKAVDTASKSSKEPTDSEADKPTNTDNTETAKSVKKVEPEATTPTQSAKLDPKNVGKDQIKKPADEIKKPADDKPQEAESDLPLISTTRKSKYAEPVVPRLDAEPADSQEDTELVISKLDENKNIDDIPLIPRSKRSTGRDFGDKSSPVIQDIKIRPNRGISAGKAKGLASMFEPKAEKGVDKILPSLRSSGVVRNRMAMYSSNSNNSNNTSSISSRYGSSNLNSNNSNNNDVEDNVNLNCNNNNNNDSSEDEETPAICDTREEETTSGDTGAASEAGSEDEAVDSDTTDVVTVDGTEEEESIVPETAQATEEDVEPNADSNEIETIETADDVKAEASEDVEPQKVGNVTPNQAADEELDPVKLNTNNNYNLDDILAASSGGGDFVFDNHLMEMAGGDMYPPQQSEAAREPHTETPVTRGAAGLPRCSDRGVTVQNVTCNVTLLPSMNRVESVKAYLERLMAEDRDNTDLEMDVIFILLQVLNIIFGLNESQLRLESISSNDFIIVTDEHDVATLHCHNINVAPAPNQKLGLTCEKLRMFLMQVSHATPSLQKSVLFTTVDDMVQNAEDMGDLRTIGAILQYLLWGPKEDEVKIITLAEHRRQAFELWLHLARGKLVSGLALKPIDNIKAYMVTNFLANTNGSELFKITKLLNTY